MNVDAELMFDCLLYINAFFFAMFLICEVIMVISKYFSVVPTLNIGRDAGVVFCMLGGEFVKLILFRKYRITRRGLISGICIFLNFVTLFCAFYTFVVEDPALMLERILCYLMVMLCVSQIVFGIIQPCYKHDNFSM